MTFPLETLYPAQHPDRIQLYAAPTPNGVKVSIMLEETGLPYEPPYVDIMNNATHAPEYLAMNPNGKIPGIIDPAGPSRAPMARARPGIIRRLYACGSVARPCAGTPCRAARPDDSGAPLDRQIAATQQRC